MRRSFWYACVVLGTLALAGCAPLRAYQAIQLLKAGRHDEAIELHLEATKAVEQASGPEEKTLAIYLSTLSVMYEAKGDYRQAEATAARALRIARKGYGPEHIRVAYALNSLGNAYLRQAKYKAAEQSYQRALKIFEREKGKDDFHIGVLLNNYANLLLMSGRYYQAEPMLRRALAVYEEAKGRDDRDTGTVLLSLGSVYVEQGRHEEALHLFERAREIKETALGAEHPELAFIAANLCGSYTYAKHFDQADVSCQRAFTLFRDKYGAAHPNTALMLHNLAFLAHMRGDRDRAIRLYKESLALKETSVGKEDRSYAETEMSLAQAYFLGGRQKEAEPIYLRSVTRLETALGPQHPRLALALSDLGAVYHALGDHDKALRYLRRATDIFASRAERQFGERSRGALREDKSASDHYYLHLRLLGNLVTQAKEGSAAKKQPLFIEAFDIVQYAHAGRAARAVSQMAARFGAGDDALARVVRERQDALVAWQRQERELVRSLSAAKRNRRHEDELRAGMARLDKKIAAFDATLRRDFPEYAELVSGKPMEGAAVQGLLKPDEALVTYIVAPHGAFVVVARHNDAAVGTLAINEKQLNTTVRALRERLDPTLLTDLSEIRHFAVEQAYLLYQQVFAPIEPFLKGVRHVMVVPDGALESIPFSVLLTAPEAGGVTDFGAYRSLSWLGKRYAFTTLPSVSSLRALRRFARESKADEAFIGFGNPVLVGDPGRSRGIQVAKLFARGSIADVDEVRRLPPLPDTEDELRALARALSPGTENIFVQDAASEATLRAADLTKYRTVAFATHGLMAGDFRGLAEPALVFTPPRTGTPENDGLLTASEIAQLELNADWVLLSACNTAAADGTPGAEGLSGLARAFFYAGSRTLLVSHWAVLSDATVLLTTRMFEELAREPGLRRAAALQRAAATVRNSNEKPYFAHPMFWAPFVVVGEGGSLG